jgi:hypothetical protein
MLKNPCRTNTEIWFLEPVTFLPLTWACLSSSLAERAVVITHDVIYDLFSLYTENTFLGVKSN